CRLGAHAIHVVRGPTLVELHVYALRPSQLCELLPERLKTHGEFRIALGVRHQNADAPHPLGLLRARRERPRRRSAEQRYELAALHSITSSARASTVAGISRPSVLAVVRFRTRSNLVGCSTGRSAGLAPRRILSTKSAARRNWLGQFDP